MLGIAADDYVSRYMTVGREGLALDMIDGLLEREKDDVMLLLMKSDIYAQMGEYEKDYELLAKISESNALMNNMNDEVIIELTDRLSSYEAEVEEIESLDEENV